MNRSRSRLILSVLSLALAFSAWHAEAQLPGTSIRTRWDSPSTLTPDQAAVVLTREAKGESVSDSQLLEARKHLRTDRSVSFAGQVSRKIVENLLREGLDGDVRIRSLPTVLAWLDPASFRDAAGEEVVRLRGEVVQLAVANLDPNLAATTLVHFSFHEDWRFCSGLPCRAPLPGPVRESIGYDLSIPLDSTAPAEASTSELVLATGFQGTVHRQFVPTLDPSRFLGAACDPLPSSTRTADASGEMSFVHLAERTEHGKQNRVLCGFFAIGDGRDARFLYSVDGVAAGAPPEASASAVVNNPLWFTMFE